MERTGIRSNIHQSLNTSVDEGALADTSAGPQTLGWGHHVFTDSLEHRKVQV